MDRSEIVIQTFKEHVCDIVRAVAENEKWSTLSEFKGQALAEYIARHGEPQTPFDRRYLQAAVLLEMKRYEATRQSSATNTQRSTQAT
jgi:hypothetical protein